MAPIVERWNFTPLLETYWREVMAHAQRTPLLGERFAAARRALERRWGCVQREVPMSRVCRTEAFAWFACSILRDLPAFHQSYNEIVHDHRARNHIRSRSHPVPDLAADGAWLETPFWAWRRGQARRGRLFLNPTATAWHLRVGADAWPSIPCQRLDDAVAAWRALEAAGYKIRSRALTTTMFARLFCADVFVHGIGGGIYDALTDQLIDRWFATPAPPFLVLSATLHLPLPRYPNAANEASALERRLRELTYKPERFTASTPQTDRLLREKNAWIGRTAATHAQRVERFERLRAINASLQPFVQPAMQHAHRLLEECRRQMEWDSVAGRRDYAFCLYPEDMLRALASGATEEPVRPA